MKTPTHLAINWLILKRFNVSKKNQIAFLLGGVMPDVAIILTFTFVFLLVHPFSEALATFRALYDHNVWLIGLHSLLHSPLSLAFLFLFAFVIKPYQRRLESFLAGCFCHSLIDIYTHVDDGPLVFWPFNLTYRFESLISHWHPDYYGNQMLIFECLLFSLIGVILLTRYMREKYQWTHLGQLIIKPI